MYIHQNIRYLREINKLSQPEFAAIFNLTRGKVQTYERNVEPSFEILSKISEYFEINIDDLIKTDIENTKGLDLKRKENNIDVKTNIQIGSDIKNSQNANDHEFEKMTIKLEMLERQLEDKQEIIDLLKNQIAELKAKLLEKHSG